MNNNLSVLLYSLLLFVVLYRTSSKKEHMTSFSGYSKMTKWVGTDSNKWILESDEKGDLIRWAGIDMDKLGFDPYIQKVGNDVKIGDVLYESTREGYASNGIWTTTDENQKNWQLTSDSSGRLVTWAGMSLDTLGHRPNFVKSGSDVTIDGVLYTLSSSSPSTTITPAILPAIPTSLPNLVENASANSANSGNSANSANSANSGNSANSANSGNSGNSANSGNSGNSTNAPPANGNGNANKNGNGNATEPITTKFEDFSGTWKKIVPEGANKEAYAYPIIVFDSDKIRVITQDMEEKDVTKEILKDNVNIMGDMISGDGYDMFYTIEDEKVTKLTYNGDTYENRWTLNWKHSSSKTKIALIIFGVIMGLLITGIFVYAIVGKRQSRKGTWQNVPLDSIPTQQGYVSMNKEQMTNYSKGRLGDFPLSRQ